MKIVSMLAILFVFVVASSAQTKPDITLIRKGNSLLAEKKYNDAEIAYRKALQINSKNGTAAYNLALALQLQKKTDEAIKQYELAISLLTDKLQKAGAYHNTGNALCMTQEWEKAIEQYKSALRLNPTDMDTKYNLAFAQSKLKQQQQQNNNDKKQEPQKSSSENKGGEGKEDKKNEQKPNPGEMTKEQAQQLQKAIQAQEAKVNDKIQKSDKKAIVTTNEKDW
jgi:tetratricopeptide (TPR) repeat protein